MSNTQQLLCRNIQICTSLSFSLCGASVSQLIWPSSIRENPFGSFGCFCLQSVCATSTGVLRVFMVQSGRWSIIGTPTLKVCVSLTNAPVWETGGMYQLESIEKIHSAQWSDSEDEQDVFSAADCTGDKKELRRTRFLLMCWAHYCARGEKTKALILSEPGLEQKQLVT